MKARYSSSAIIIGHEWDRDCRCVPTLLVLKRVNNVDMDAVSAPRHCKSAHCITDRLPAKRGDGVRHGS